MEKFFTKVTVSFFLVVFFITTAEAQIQEAKFDSIYVHTATTLSATDIQRALQVADSLFTNSQSSNQEMKSLMLLATLKGRIGETAEALAYAMKAEGIARKDRNDGWQIRIAGFLATTFREANLIEEGKKYIELAEKAHIKSNDNSPSYKIIKAFIYQEKAYHRIDEKDYEGAIEELQKAESEISKTPEASRNKVFMATNYQLLGSCYLRQENHEKAYALYNLSLDELGEQESELKAFVYNGIGEIEMHRENYDSAFEFFKKAESYVETADNFNIKESLYKNLSTYHNVLGNQAESARYNELYIDYVNSSFLSTKEISNQIIKQLRLEKEGTIKNNHLLLGAALFLAVLILFLLIRFRNIQKKEKEKYDEVIRKMKTSKSLYKENTKSSKQGVANSETPIMTKETQERILDELAILEEETFFTSRDISLSSLATRLNTNPKYLSYVINTHKGKDFNNYINELRIKFVIDKLHNHPEYLDYKLSYIAEECGFSSHSKFAAVFKDIVELSPSTFISHLKSDLLEKV